MYDEMQQIDLDSVEPDDVVAKVGDTTIKGEDLTYEIKRLALIFEL